MKKIRRRDYRFLFIIIIFVVFLIFRNIYISKFKYKTILLDSLKTYTVEIPVNALVVKDEQVYFLDQVLTDNNESRIPVNKSLGNLSEYRNDLGIDDKELQKLQDLYLKKDLVEEASTAEEEDLEEKYSILDLKEDLIAGNIEQANNYIKNNYSKSVYNAEERSVKELEFSIYEEMLKNVGMNLKSLNSGIISTEVDGFETIYNYSNFSKLNFNIYNKDSNIQEKPGFKIINNSKIGLYFHIPTEKLLNTYGLGKDILFNISEREIPGKIKDMQVIDEETIFQVELREAFEYFKNKRFAEIDLINYKTDAFEIPKKTLVEKDGQKGVYIKLPSSIVAFVPIEILDEDSNNIIINSGMDGEIQNYNKKVKTVGLYDEIILNPKLVEEGMLLD